MWKHRKTDYPNRSYCYAKRTMYLMRQVELAGNDGRKYSQQAEALPAADQQLGSLEKLLQYFANLFALYYGYAYQAYIENPTGLEGSFRLTASQISSTSRCKGLSLQDTDLFHIRLRLFMSMNVYIGVRSSRRQVCQCRRIPTFDQMSSQEFRCLLDFRQDRLRHVVDACVASGHLDE